MDKTVYFSAPKDVTHGRGYVYSLQYHIVWVTKYRNPIFIGGIEMDVKQYLMEAGYVFPSMYRSVMYNRKETYKAQIKVHVRNTWDWITVDLRRSDVDYIN